MKPLTLGLLMLIMSCDCLAMKAGEELENFSLPSLSGSETIHYAHYKGLVVYIDFWASWCPPCAKAFPELNKIYWDLQPYGFEIIAISTDENIDDAHRFLKKYPASFVVAHDQTGALAKRFNLPGMPAGYLIDSEGNIKKVVLGLKSKKDVDALVEEIKKELGV